MTKTAFHSDAGMKSPPGGLQPPDGEALGTGMLPGVLRRAARDVPKAEAALRTTLHPVAGPSATDIHTWQAPARLRPHRLTSDRGSLRGTSHAPATPQVTRRLGPTFGWGPFHPIASPIGAAALLLLPATASFAETGSLLQSLLQDAPAISASLSNIAQDLGPVDGSFALSVERNFADLSAGLEGWGLTRSEAAAGQAARATDLQDDALARLGGVTLQVGSISTTAVGSMQAADLTGSFNAGGLTNRVFLATDTATLSIDERGGIAGLVALQNVSLNSGEILASADLLLADVDARTDNIGTTAIGALQNGALRTSVDLSATVQGQMGDFTATTAALLAALVGS